MAEPPTPLSRRNFLLNAGRGVGLLALGGVAGRVLWSGRDENTSGFIQPNHGYAWQIDPEKCTFCGRCETACVRTPAAVKAVNDQKKCSNCVVCYGHILDRKIASDQIQSHAKRVCPHDAVSRKALTQGLDGAFRYEIDPRICSGCGQCARECNSHGTKSMFLIIRPDLCLGCNSCEVARACPDQAVERVPSYGADDFRGYYQAPGNEQASAGEQGV